MMRHRRYLLVIVTVLLLASTATAQINQTPITTDGGEVPTIHDMWFDQLFTQEGQNVTLHANITDVDGVSTADAGIYNESGYLLDRYNFTYNSSSSLWDTTFEVNSSWVYNNSLYVGDAYVEDSLGYSDTVNGTFLNGTAFTSPSVEIDTPTTIYDIWFGKSTVSTGENVTVYADLYDPDGGVSFADIGLFNSTPYLLHVFTLSYNSSSGYWETEFTVQSAWTHNGSIWVGDSVIDDNSGHSRYYTGSLTNGSDFVSPKLDIQSSTSNTSQIIDIGFDPNVAKNGQSVKILAQIDDPDGVSHAEVMLYNSSFYPIVSPALSYNSSSGYWETNITVDPNWMHNGSLWIGEAFVEDNLNNTEQLLGSFLGGNNFTSPELQINNPGIVYDIWFNQSYAEAGENITVFGDLSDPEGISYADVGLFNSNHSLVEIVTFTYYNTTSGFYQGYFKANSSWTISSNDTLWAGDVYMEDNQGDGTYLKGTFINGNDFYSESIQINDTGISGYIEINYSILSSPLTTGTNESFEIELLNHFDFTKYNLSLEGILKMPNGTIYQQTLNSTFALEANSQFSTQFTHVFDQNGTYLFEFTVYDNMNQSWSQEFDFNVEHQDDDDTGDGDDGEETNSTTSATNTTEGVETPDLQLPVPSIWIGIAIVIPGIIVRRRRNQ